MSSSAHVQFVKWSLPAFALILGLLWYKRRRVDRVDPGGSGRSSSSRSSGGDVSLEKTLANGGSSSLCDSGIDETFSLNLSSQPSEEVICGSRRVSESLDIPMRRSSSHLISIQSAMSSTDSQAWLKDVDVVSDGIDDIQLGSNPRASNFEMVVRSRGGSSFVTDAKMPLVFEKLPEHDEHRLGSEVEPFEGADEGNDGNVHLKDANPAESKENSTRDDVKDQVQALSERDSANHSPVSGVLEGSVTDEARSEGSTDSGKGGSIRGHAKDASSTTVYEFNIPQHLVGRLIGRHGSFLHTIRTKTMVHVVIKRHPTSRVVRVCAITGSAEGINAALEIVRQRFPLRKYPDVTLERVTLTSVPEEMAWMTDLTCLSLVEGVSNDVIVCHILKPNRLFIQLPTHPSYPSLRMLDANMTQLYDTTESPEVPDQITKGMIFVAKWFDRWIRVYVETPDPTGERHLVRSLDHGGYWHFSSANMRKIRSDYLTLPFQAIEVFLANVQPKDGEWQREAFDVVVQMCSGVVAQAHIEGYIDNNTYVNLYLNVQRHGVISLADELIARGFAVPVPFEETVPEEIVLSS